MTDPTPTPTPTPPFDTPEPTVLTTGSRRRRRLRGWRAEALRTTFWVLPCLLVLVAAICFAITYGLDVAASHHDFAFPSWIDSGNADAAREVVTAIAAAVITVVGVVFSVTIVALTLASQQFGPRMMRTFMRDIGNQLTLAVFVGTFVYAVLTLGFIHGTFVPHLSVTVSEALLLVDLAFLIYFIHHIAISIQLPEVIARIAEDLFTAIDTEYPMDAGTEGKSRDRSEAGRVAWAVNGPTAEELGVLLETRGAMIPAAKSGYLQFVALEELVSIATRLDAVIRLSHQPGHFVLVGRPIAAVFPRGAAEQVRNALTKAHLTGPYRTLSQDPVFAIDQLVEMAIRALSPAVNDTFTALTCIDWLSAGLSQVSGRLLSEGVHRDATGRIRLIEREPSYTRMVNRAFDKVRQAGRGMPAVDIRLLDAIAHIVEFTHEPGQRATLLRQGQMVMEGAQRDIVQAEDLADTRRRFDELEILVARMDQPIRFGA